MRSHLRLPAAALLGGTVLLLSLVAQDKPPTITFKGHTEAIYSVDFNKDGTLAVSGSFDKTVRLWDPKTGKQLREFSGPAGDQSLVLTVAFNPAGDQIASGGSDNFARVWDVPLNTPVREFAAAAGVTRGSRHCRTASSLPARRRTAVSNSGRRMANRSRTSSAIPAVRRVSRSPPMARRWRPRASMAMCDSGIPPTASRPASSEPTARP